MAKFRCGILPLTIETGRYTSIPAEFRLCLLCDLNQVEDENHFLLNCPFYDELREPFFEQAKSKFPNFEYFDPQEKLKALMDHSLVKTTAKYLWDFYEKRRSAMYRTESS